MVNAANDKHEPTGPPPPPHSAWLSWACLLVAAYLAVGFLSWKRTLIPDEIRALLLAAGPVEKELEYVRKDVLHPPLSFLLDRWWLGAFGQTDTAAKALPVVLNIPTLIVLTWVASRMTTHWRLASFLFAAPFLRAGSAVNLVRMYGLEMMFFALAFLCWLRWREQAAFPWLAAWTLAVTGMLYSHFGGWMLVAGFVVTNWFFGPRRWAFICAAALAALTLVPWIVSVIPVYRARGIEANMDSIRQEKDPTFALLQLPFFFLSGEVPGGGAPMHPLHEPSVSPTLKVAAGCLQLALFLAAWSWIRRQWPPHGGGERLENWFWIQLCLFCVPLILLYLFSVSVVHSLQARYVLGVLLAYWLLIITLANSGKRLGRIILHGAVVPWVALSIVASLYLYSSISPARRAADFVAEQVRGTDLILCEKHMPIGWQFFWEWTRRLHHAERVEILSSPMPPWVVPIWPGRDLQEMNLAAVERIWLVHREHQPVVQIARALEARGFKEAVQMNGNLSTLIVFTKTQAAALPEPQRSGERR